jgi:hypothetical protein
MKPNKFIDRSEFIKPVVVFEYNGSFMSNIKTFDIAHNLPFVPLIIGEYSFNSDFSNARDFRFWTSGDENFLVGALERTIRFAIRGVNPPRRVYVRLIGIAPPDYAGELIPLKRRILNDSRNRSLKILNFGAFRNDSIVEHNLGYLPMVYFWEETVIFRENSSSVRDLEKCLRPSSPVNSINNNEVHISGRGDGKGYYAIFGDAIDEN